MNFDIGDTVKHEFVKNNITLFVVRISHKKIMDKKILYDLVSGSYATKKAQLSKVGSASNELTYTSKALLLETFIEPIFYLDKIF